jgi:uroporphyrinogen decarboxylase
MKLIICSPGGVLENAIRLAGFENLCFMLMDSPELAQNLFDAIGSRLIRHYEIAVQYDAVGAIFGNDDWGFKGQTMLSVEQIRKYVMPWHKKIVQTAHDAGKPAIMHSCGCLEKVMDDIIDFIGYDGKHSYEDTIMPVEEAWGRYSHRIAIMGGLDLNFIVQSTPQQIYRRAKEMLKRTSGCKAYSLGTGNSVPEYVPNDNYFAMIKAAYDTGGFYI